MEDQILQKYRKYKKVRISFISFNAALMKQSHRSLLGELSAFSFAVFFYFFYLLLSDPGLFYESSIEESSE